MHFRKKREAEERERERERERESERERDITESTMAKSGRSKLRGVDYFRKVPRDLTEGSLSGGGISILATVVIVLLVIGETCTYMSVKTVTDIYADTTTNGELRMNFDVYFPEVSCEHLEVDMFDSIGNLKSNVTANISKFARKTSNEPVQGSGSGGGRKAIRSRTSWLSKGKVQGPTLKPELSSEGSNSANYAEEHQEHLYASGHFLEKGEEAKIVEEYESSHPDLVKWYTEMPLFKNVVEQDQELIKAAMALTLSWKDEEGYEKNDQKRTVYGGKQASFDVTSQEDFEYLADNYNILLLDFHAPWCSHCIRFSPTWELVAYYFNNALHLMQDVYHNKVGDYTKAPPAIDLQTQKTKRENLPKSRIAVANINCVKYNKLCGKHQIAGYPAIRVYSNKAANHEGTHETHIDFLKEYASYKGGRSVTDLVKFGLQLSSDLYPSRKDFVSMLISEEGDSVQAHPSVVSEKPVLESASMYKMLDFHSMEGCRITGYVDGSRVPGIVRFQVTGQGSEFDPSLLNMTHEIKSLHFGRQKLEPYMSDYLLKYNQGSPYERSLKLVDDYEQVLVARERKLSYQHYIKVVTTSMQWSKQSKIFTAHEMSVNTNSFKQDSYDPKVHPELHQTELPSVVFHYDLSPLQILIREEKETLFRFIVNLCAILGGVFTVASMIDGIIYKLTKEVLKIE